MLGILLGAKNKTILVTIFGLSLVLLILGGLVYSTMGTSWENDGSEKPKIAVSVFPIYSLAKELAGQEVQVELVLPIGASPHLFEPKPSDLARVAKAEAFLVVGHGLDSWAEKMAESGGAKRIVVIDQDIPLLSGSHQHGDEEAEIESEQYDPHYWLSVPNAMIISRNITASLTQMFPDKSELWAERNNLLVRKLVDLDREIKANRALRGEVKIATFHPAWDYFAFDYEVEIVGEFEETPGREPGANEIASFIEGVKEAGLTRVFSEPQLSQLPIQSIAGDLGVEVDILDPLGGVEGRSDYFELMRYNSARIFDGQ